MSILSRNRNVIAVRSCHFLHVVQSSDLLRNFLTKSDNIVCHCAVATVSEILLLLFDKEIYTIKSNTTIVTNDSSTTICVWKTCDNLVVTSLLHFRSICIENSLVMSCCILCENLMKLWVWSIAVCFTSLLSHFDTAERHKCTLKRLICLKTNNLLKVLCFFTYIAWIMRCKGRNDMSIHIKNATLSSFFLLKSLENAPKSVCSFCRTCKER